MAALPMASLARHPFFLLATIYAHWGVLMVAAAYRLVDPSLPELGFLSYCVCIGFEAVLYANRHLCVTDRAPPPPDVAAAGGSGSSSTWKKKACWAAREVLFAPRGEMSDASLPPFDGSDAAYVPSRRAFLAEHAAILLLAVLARRAFDVVDGAYWYQTVEDNYGPAREGILRRALLSSSSSSSSSPAVAWREAGVRAWLAVQFNFPTYADWQAIYSLCALGAVGVLGHDHARWRPLFGDVREAYTLRRYWGVFWQQFHRTAFVTHARLLAVHVLRIRNRAMQRAVIGILVFALLALMHALCLKAQGPRCDTWPVIRWWLLVGGAIIVEDLVCLALRRLVRPARWTYLVGYVWVFFFFWWSRPKIDFPTVDCEAL
ncbi:hypothetical protein GGTG_12773 [Gaeumannomyces tritici R3-111a-1]|uniref:Wax synthase domain-containing protein n=1 Tax=Gaeumannomyces tritici (strain R3-111a-1) TaxID=644352 RepID=J3PGZ3_GAET3|nr:hypothetical protein GGTG_12773 [Gaeumannomyces tritici R3-111a-1]EJT69890.1 hypothetical protein GGTG_12773 [Gaeumannomyces tritici R3-111a-1]